MIDNFNNDLINANANEKGSSMTDDEVKTLPDISQINNFIGKKEGDTKIFKTITNRWRRCGRAENGNASGKWWAKTNLPRCSTKAMGCLMPVSRTKYFR